MSGTSRTQAIVNLAIKLTPALGQKEAIEEAISKVSASESSKILARKIFKKILLIGSSQGNPLHKKRTRKKKIS